jgi:hypothetical protein
VPSTEDVLRSPADLIREATSGLTGPEREVFLHRLKEEHSELFSGENGEDGRQLPEGPTEEFSKEETSRLMVAAASLQSTCERLVTRSGYITRGKT